MPTENPRPAGRVQDSFGPNAEKYVTSQAHANPADLQRLVDQVRPAGGRFLDLATGAGHCGLAFAPHVDEVVLADLTPEMLAVAARQAGERGLTNVSTREVDVMDLPFEAEQFDYVSCRIAAHHFPDQPRAVAEMRRVLRPGGRLIFVDNVVPDDPESAAFINTFETIRDPSHAHCYSEREMTAIIERTGFAIDTTSARRKNMDLVNWCERLNVSPADIDRLGEMLDRAPEAARASLTPRVVNGRRVFDLVETTWIARRVENSP